MRVVKPTREPIGENGTPPAPAVKQMTRTRVRQDKMRRKALTEDIIKQANGNGNGEGKKPQNFNDIHFRHTPYELDGSNKQTIHMHAPVRMEITTARQAESEYFLDYRVLLSKLNEYYSITFAVGQNPKNPLFSWKHNWRGTPGQYRGNLELFISIINGKCNGTWTGNSGNVMRIRDANILPTLKSFDRMELKARVPVSETRIEPQPVQKEVQETAAPLLLDNEKTDDTKLAQNYLNRCKSALSEIGKIEPILVIVESADGEYVWKSDKMKENIMHNGKKMKETYAARVGLSLLNGIGSTIIGKMRNHRSTTDIFSIGQLDNAISMLKERFASGSARTNRKKIAANDYQDAE